MRKTIIAGNWKMNKTRKEAREFFGELKNLVENNNAEVIIAAPYTLLETSLDATKDGFCKISAENMNENDKGAYTGEISADMLLDLGVKYTLLGHSERRTYYNETDEKINLKTLKSIEKGITPIICVGETLEERESNKTLEVLTTQIKTAYKGVTKEEASKTVIAYEPVWAIGTGKTASPEMAQETHAEIRKLLVELFGDVASEIRILYGGSMNDKNAKDLLAKEDIDGGLIGGASLDPKSFATIINFVK